jgi:AcrR family transcriptional regulator
MSEQSTVGSRRPDNASPVERKQPARERLLDAAEAVFRERGYNAATVQDILDSSGSGRATFYVYFKGKADVASCLLDRRRENGSDVLATLADARPLTLAEVRKWLDRSLQAWDDYRVLMDAVNHAVADDPRAAHRHWAFVEEMVAPLSRRWTGEHEAVGRLRATMLLLQWERLLWHWLVQGATSYDREVMLDAAAAVWLAQLEGLLDGPPADR